MMSVCVKSTVQTCLSGPLNTFAGTLDLHWLCFGPNLQLTILSQENMAMRDKTAQFLQDWDKKSQMTAKKFKSSIQNVIRIMIVKAAVLAVFNYLGCWWPSKLCGKLEFYFIRMWVLIENEVFLNAGSNKSNILTLSKIQNCAKLVC